MSEDHTRSVTVKRNTKKKSGYLVSEEDGDYIIAEVPAKARVNAGDRVVGINGIKADEFVDEDDANALIESIRIVVVPEDEIEEYEAAQAAEGAENNALAVVPKDKNIQHCPHCQHDNQDLSEDEDGDLVCEQCGHVIEQEVDEGVHHCGQCGHDNLNLERDEDGEYVCEECGYVIPEDNAVVMHDDERKKHEYPCPDCGHITIDPEPDDEGDRICEECGCILAEKIICKCDSCGKENVDPEQNEDGEFICQECGEVLPIEEEQQKSGAEKLQEMHNEAADEVADGQEFDDTGKPTTNAQGKKLTPADMFKPGDVITVTVGKSNPKQDPGLKIEERNGKYYVRKVPTSGLFARTPVIAGDKILELNGTDSHDFKDVNELKKVCKDEERITVVVLRKDPDDTESSASSVDYDNLAPVTADGVQNDEISERDDDTAGYDGEDCGCVWCPDCHG